MTDTRDLTPGDRRELRSLVKRQFAVLRNDVKRRAQELTGEIEAELLARYRAQDEAVADAKAQVQRVNDDMMAALARIAEQLRAARPELTVQTGMDYRNGGPALAAADPNRSQTHKALIAAIPGQIADASTRLDQDELDLLRDLTIGALSSGQAHEFLARIPTVGQLVPKSRLAELAGGDTLTPT